MIVQCLFKKVHRCYIYSKKLPYQNIRVFKYRDTGFVLRISGTSGICITYTPSLSRTRIVFQNNFHVFELLIILFISVFEILYWKCKNVCNACVQDKEKN